MANSYPTAASLGILANGTDQTTALNTALSNVNYSGIIFDYSAPGAVTINGAVTATGKVLQFLKGNTLTGTGSVTGGYIDAPYDVKIWDTTLLIKPQGTVGKYYSLKWSGATGGGSVDDWAAIQNDINICTYNGLRELYLPAGTYKISQGLLFRQDNGGQYQGLTPPAITTSHFLSGMHLTGDGIAYDGTSGQTSLLLTNADSFAIGVQRVKGFKCSGIFCTGVNTGLGSYTAYQVLQDPSTTFISNSSRDNTLSPHCGMIVDPFGSSATGSTDRFPNYTGYYVETSTGGSTDIEFEDCVFRFFTVGRAVSVNGYSNNGEIVTFRSVWADYNKVSLATGQSQARSVICYGDHVWGGTLNIYDARTYGGGTGCPVTSIGLNTAGANRYLCVNGNTFSNGLTIIDAHIELLASLGGNFTAVAGFLRIEDSWVNFAGSIPSAGINQPFTIYNGGSLKVTNSVFSQYGASVGLPLSVNTPEAIFENARFDLLPINNYGNSSTSYRNCHASNGNGDFGDGDVIGWNTAAFLNSTRFLFTTGMKAVFPNFIPGGGATLKDRKKQPNNAAALVSIYTSKMMRDVVPVPFSANITLTSVNYTTNQATFNLTATSVDYKNLQVGDTLTFFTTDEFGNTNALTAFGQILTLSAGVVTINGICKNLNTTTSYLLFIYRNEFLIPQLILGDVTSGSAVVSNILMEGNVHAVLIGTPVYMPHFPLGTYIAGYNSGTNQITMSNNAVITETNVAVISSDWIGEETGVLPLLSNANYIAYKKGDRIYNNRTDLNPNITYWECTRSGITNTTSLPEFVSYDATESATYSASSVTATTADVSKVIFLTATSNSITYTINPAKFRNLRQSLFGIISGANTITITPSSGTINGAASYALTNNQCIEVYSNGTNLFIVAKA